MGISVRKTVHFIVQTLFAFLLALPIVLSGSIANKQWSENIPMGLRHSAK
ncbi:hypothetical protein AB4Z22_02765 [Paenibacillus sp. TAF58]